MSIIFDAMKNVINLKQNEQEPLIEYTQRFKTARDLLVSQVGGPIVLTQFVESMDGYNPTETKKFQEIAFEQFLAFTYLENGDKSKYGSLLNNLKQQQSLKHDQYPKTVSDALNLLNNHKLDNIGKKYNEKTKENEEKIKIEEENNIPELSFAQLEGRCYCCGKVGHKSPKCWDKNKSRESGM